MCLSCLLILAKWVMRFWHNWRHPSKESDVDIAEITSQQHETEPNYLFYTNRIVSRPNGDTIENILQYWFGDSQRLEDHHGYIQWLFPLTEKGIITSEASPLTANEIIKLSTDQEAMNRMLKSFKLMLDFYGMVMRNDEYIERAAHWPDAYRNLTRHTHNYSRITRILKSLTIFHHDYYCLMWLKFLAKEVYETKELSVCQNSFEQFWLPSCSYHVQDEFKKLI